VSESSKTVHRVLGWRLAAGAAGIAAVLGCASPPPPEQGPSYQEQMSRWQGETEADLVTTWGMPQKTHVLADGGRIIEYRQAGEEETSCTTRFTLDPSGKIVRWWYSGVNCSAPKTG
jgi:hypothetical protein